MSRRLSQVLVQRWSPNRLVDHGSDIPPQASLDTLSPAPKNGASHVSFVDDSNVIEVVGLRKLFGSFAAVDGLDLVVPQGEVHGFLGPNGAGKTTAIRVLLGLYRRDAGAVAVLGLDPADEAAAINRRVSYVPGDVSLWPNLTGQEVLDALAGLRGAYDVAMERQLVEEFALNPRKKVRAYSKGNRQKVILIAALAARTESQRCSCWSRWRWSVGSPGSLASPDVTSGSTEPGGR